MRIFAIELEQGTNDWGVAAGTEFKFASCVSSPSPISDSDPYIISFSDSKFPIGILGLSSAVLAAHQP